MAAISVELYPILNKQPNKLSEQIHGNHVGLKSALQAAAATTALLCGGGVGASVPHDILLGRWRLALDLFGRVFVDDVGLEPGSIISELGGFPVKV